MGHAVILQTTGDPIGTVTDIYRAGNGVLEVTRTNSPDADSQPPPRTVLIPFVEAIVPVVDLTRRGVEITPPGGLRDGCDLNMM